ncbi:MAG: filamentous hemagglutinin N-terminal domain-containing protein [Planctomycetota bacterium]|jgi:filamentous hemagglutinin family protein
MMENLLKKLKGRYFRKVIIYFLTWCLITNTSLQVVLATPMGGVFTYPVPGPGVDPGTIVDGVADSVVTVNQAQSVIEWGELGVPGSGGIDTAAGETLTFLQKEGLGLSNSAVLNRIISGDPTSFGGVLNGQDMRIFIVNPAGIVFEGGSSVNVTQLVASSLDIADQDFIDGNYEFLIGDGIGAVTNNGTINAVEGAALIGKKVLNTGTITTGWDGFVVMAAGDRVLLGQPGSKIVVEMDSVTLSNPENPEGFGTVINDIDGKIESSGGKVVLAAGDIFSIPLHPQLQAESGEVADQPVRVESGIGTVTQSGKINYDVVDDGGSVILTAGDEVILAEGSTTQAIDGEVIAYASEFGTNGITGATTSFEDGATINVGTGTAEISGNHILFAGSVNALPEGTIQVDPVTLTIADTMPETGPELDTLYEEQHIEFYSQAGVNLDLAADELITVEYMANSDPVGEITGGSGDITLRNVFANGGIYFEQEDEAGQTGPRSSIRTVAYYESASVHRDGGSIYMDAGTGGIVAGDLETGTLSQDKWSQPGEIVLRTTNGSITEGSDIEVGTMRAEGASSTQVSAIAGGDLIVNGDVVSINKQTDNEETSVFKAITCLIAEGDIDLNGNNYQVSAHGKGLVSSDIRISAGQNVTIGSENSPATITAESKVSGAATQSAAYIVIHAGRNLYDPEEPSVPIPGVITINGQTYEPGEVYFTDGDITAKAWPGPLSIDTAGTPTTTVDTESVWQDPVPPEPPEPLDFFARIEINSNETDLLSEGPCAGCPTPPGLPPVPRLFIIGDDSFTVGRAAEGAQLDVLENDDNSFRLLNGEIIDPTPAGGEWTIETIEVEEGIFAQVFIYTPPSDAVFVWDGESDVAEFTDTFTYKAKDEKGNVSVNTATVTIAVQNFLPVLSGDSETIHMSTAANPANEIAEFDLDGLINDTTDGSYQPLIIGYDDSGTVGGTVSLADSTATYEPDNGFVTEPGTPDTFQYTVKDDYIVDEFGDPVVLSGTIEVTVDNTLPTGSGDLGAIHMDTQSIQSQIDVTSPVSIEDSDGVDPLSIIEDTYIGSNGGTLVYDETDWTYTPNPDTPGYVGDPDGLPDETFTIQIWDGQYDYGLEQPVTADTQVVVELTNVLPFAGDSVDLFLDKPAGVSINGVLTGYDRPDTFAGGEIDTLIITLPGINPDGTLTTVNGGTIALAPDGESFTYDPPSDSFLGPDSFTFEVSNRR